MSERLIYSLPTMSIGTSREVTAFRYGKSGARPKIYLQAALHADELPGQLVLHRLRMLLDRAAATGQIRGEIVLVPVANPIGLSQVFGSRNLGRYELSQFENFNRNFPDLSTLPETVEFGPDPARNLGLVRAIMRQQVEAMPEASELQVLRKILLGLAVDADMVLDLHCDQDAAMHVYTGDRLWPGAADLAGELGAVAVLLAQSSGGNPFDEVFSGAFARISDRLGPARPVPADACLSATIELRGEADVSGAFADQDAAALFRALQRRGAIAGDPGLPVPSVEATPLTGVDVIRASVPGLLVFHLPVAAQVRKGDIVAEIIDPLAPAGRPAAILRSRTDGVLFARVLDKLARPGAAVAKIAGTEPLPDRVGHLLID